MLLRVNEQRNILHQISKRKANWIGHILRRNCLLKQVSKKRVKYTEQKSCPLFCICVKLGLLQMLSVFDDGVPRKIFGPQVEEVNG